MTSGFKFIFATQDDPFYVRCFFEEFFKIYPHPEEIRGLIIQSPMGKKTKKDLMRQMYGFYGMVDFTRMGWRYFKVAGLKKLGRLYPQSQWLDLQQMCAARNVGVLRSNNIHHPDVLQKLRHLAPDLIVSVAAPSIFRDELIHLPRLGCINIHHAPLPRYRGMMPNFWQLYHGEKKVGVTIHRMSPKIDEGDIILQREIAVDPGESLDELIRRTKRLGAHYMVEAIGMMKSGNVQCRENRPEEGSYHSFPKREDVRKFRAMGYRLL